MASKVVASAPTLLSKFLRFPTHRSYGVTPLSTTTRAFSSRKSFNEIDSSPFLRAGEVGHCRVDKTMKDCCVMRVDVPGIPDEKGVVLWVESSYIHFKANDLEIPCYNYEGRVFGGSISCNPSEFNLDNVKSEVRNGVLWIVVPRFRK